MLDYDQRMKVANQIPFKSFILFKAFIITNILHINQTFIDGLILLVILYLKCFSRWQKTKYKTLLFQLDILASLRESRFQTEMFTTLISWCLRHKLHFNGFPFSWKEVSKKSWWRNHHCTYSKLWWFCPLH